MLSDIMLYLFYEGNECSIEAIAIIRKSLIMLSEHTLQTD